MGWGQAWDGLEEGGVGGGRLAAGLVTPGMATGAGAGAEAEAGGWAGIGVGAGAAGRGFSGGEGEDDEGGRDWLQTPQTNVSSTASTPFSLR